jgi:hypothetical protein
MLTRNCFNQGIGVGFAGLVNRGRRIMLQFVKGEMAERQVPGQHPSRDKCRAIVSLWDFLVDDLCFSNSRSRLRAIFVSEGTQVTEEAADLVAAEFDRQIVPDPDAVVEFSQCFAAIQSGLYDNPGRVACSLGYVEEPAEFFEILNDPEMTMRWRTV